MKNKVIVCIMLCSMLFTGCSVSTPDGTLYISFDRTATTEETVITDSNGNSTVIDTSSISSCVEQALDTVALPDGVNRDEMKKFVYDNLSNLGIDLSKLDASDTSKLDSVETIIRGTLEQNGIDTSEMDINLESILGQTEE